MHSLRVFLACLLCTGLRAATPEAPPRPVSETRFGIEVVDLYRWMEDLESSEVQDWMKAQAAATRAQLDAVPGRAELLERLEELDAALPARSGNVHLGGDGGIWFTRRLPGEEVARLYRRQGWSGEDRLMFDPETLRKQTGKAHAINWYVPSPDGKRVAVACSASGSEMAAVRFFDAADLRLLDGPIDAVGFVPLTWRDNQRVLMQRQSKAVADGPANQRWLNLQVWMHEVGQPISADRAVFGTKVLGGGQMEPESFPFVAMHGASRYALGMAVGARAEVGIYVTRVEDLDRKHPRWRKLYDFDDKIAWAGVLGDDLYLLTTKDAANGKIVRRALKNTGRTELVYSSAQVIDGVGIASDALYFRQRDGVYERLMRIPHDGGKPVEIRFDARGSFVSLLDNGGAFAHPEHPGAYVAHGTWSRPDLLLRIDPDSVTPQDTRLNPLPTALQSVDITVEDLIATSADGTRVPLSLVRPATAKRDGSNRVLLEGYGSYGISITPFFAVQLLAWQESGVALAYCHVRGGGEFGEAWHRGGFQATKANTWKDFIACAERLVELGYTRPGLIAGVGTSAGGILIGDALIERPDLFGAAIDNVGVVDTLRMTLASQNGPNHYAEAGDPRTEVGFRVLRDSSAYLKIQDGVNYPPTLIVHGVNDPRVDVWQSTKFAARLGAASPNPVLLRLDYESGHGIGSTASARRAEQADWLAFVLWQTGDARHQPPAAGASD